MLLIRFNDDVEMGFIVGDINANAGTKYLKSIQDLSDQNDFGEVFKSSTSTPSFFQKNAQRFI